MTKLRLLPNCQNTLAFYNYHKAGFERLAKELVVQLEGDSASYDELQVIIDGYYRKHEGRDTTGHITTAFPRWPQ